MNAKLLKTKEEWSRWAEHLKLGNSYQDTIKEPKEFPCWAFEVVVSWSYQDSDGDYLYKSDLKKLHEP